MIRGFYVACHNQIRNAWTLENSKDEGTEHVIDLPTNCIAKDLFRAKRPIYDVSVATGEHSCTRLVAQMRSLTGIR